MRAKIPRIEHVEVAGSMALDVSWDDHFSHIVDLSGWICDGGDLTAPLRDPAVFQTARPSEYRDAVQWGDPDGDLAIDAHHLRQRAEAQRASRSGRPERPRKAMRA